MTPPLFDLDTSLGIAFVLLALVLVTGGLALYASRCRHEWHRRYDFEQRRAFLECASCGATTAGWRYGESHTGHGKDAA